MCRAKQVQVPGDQTDQSPGVAELHNVFVSFQRGPACDCLSAFSSLGRSSPEDFSG